MVFNGIQSPAYYVYHDSECSNVFKCESLVHFIIQSTITQLSERTRLKIDKSSRYTYSQTL